MKLIVLVPAYNEEENLPKLFGAIRETYPEADILIVNDCSTDKTVEICEEYLIKHIDLPINLGIGGAMQTGYQYAYINNYDIAVQIDGDGQHNPQYIKSLVEEIKKGAGLCIGSRFINKEGFQSTNSRRIGIKFFSAIIKLFSGQTITDPTSGFRACNREVIRCFANDYPRDYPEPETVVTVGKGNILIREIPVVMNERKGGRSSITLLRSIYYIIKVSLAIFIASCHKPKGGNLNE